LQSETWEKKEVLGQIFKIVSGGWYLERERRYAWDWSDGFGEVEDYPRGRRLRESYGMGF
jgi:hypothetical protein